MKFRDESKGMYCSSGKVNPELFPPLPQQLAVLFEGATAFCVLSAGHKEMQQCIPVDFSWL